MNKKNIRNVVAILAISALLGACSEDKASENNTSSSASSSPTASASDKLETRFATLATGGASGPYNIIGTSFSDILSKTYGVNSKTQTTGASVENMNLLNQGKVEMAFVMNDVLTEAMEGSGSFPKKIDNASHIASLYANYIQVVTNKNSGINTIDDLRGKRIAVGAQNSGVEVNARNILEGHGITYQDIKVDYLGYAEAADALKAGKIDAAFLTSGIPNASLMELDKTFDMKIVTVSPEKIEELTKDKPYFLAMVIPKGTYSNTEDIPTAAIVNSWIVRSDMSDDDVYKMTKTFFESLPLLRNAHQAANDITLENAQVGMIAPIHPGAKRYYDEQAKK